MSWRSRAHPSGIKTPACPSREWWLSRKHYSQRVQKDPVLQSRGEFPDGCTVIPRYPLSSCPHWGAHTGAGGARAVTRAQPWLGPSAWLGAGCCSCCCFYSSAFLGSAGITSSVLAPVTFLWCCCGCEDAGEKPVTVLQIVVNQKSALCENRPFLILWFFLLGTGRKKVSALVHVGWFIAVCCLWALRIESLWAWD